MKTILFTCLLCLGALLSVGQNVIEVSYDNAVLLIFDSEVKKWVCGNKEFIGVNKDGATLILTAKEEYFLPTNINIQLEDGSWYGFDLKYNNAPEKKHHIITSDRAISKGTGTTEVVKEKPTGESGQVAQRDQPTKPKTSNSIKAITNIEKVARQVYVQPDYMWRIGLKTSFRMEMFIGGIWVIDGYYYMRVNLKNTTRVPYDLDHVIWTIENKGRGLKGQSALMEVKDEENGLVHVYQETRVVEAKATVTLVYVFDKFTVGDNKLLWLEIGEKGGDRLMRLDIEGNELLNAKNKL